MDLHACGVRVMAVVDDRDVINPELAAAADGLAVPTYVGGRVVDARGARRVQSITIQAADGRSIEVESDLVAMSGGWIPSIALATHLGARPNWSNRVNAFVSASRTRS
jgi:methylglutamate dehydrogenase subunit C